MSAPLRIANISFSNSAPFRALKEISGVEYEEHSPANNAVLLNAGHVDLACIPMAEYLSSTNLNFLPFGIGTKGPVESVLILSRRPLKEINRVLLDSSSRSSSAMCRVLLSPTGVRFSDLPSGDPTSLINDTTAALVIGDRAIDLRARFPYQYDLAEMWREHTGLPFVFAVWAVRQDLANDPRLFAVVAALEHGIRDRERHAMDWAAEHRTDAGYAAHYVNNCIEYSLSPAHIEGARKFAQLAALHHTLKIRCGSIDDIAPLGVLPALPRGETADPRSTAPRSLVLHPLL